MSILGSLNPGFYEVCELYADLTALRGALQRQEGLLGPYWRLKIQIVIRFGGTELEAFLEWERNVRLGESIQSVFSLTFCFVLGVHAHRAGLYNGHGTWNIGE